MDIGSIIHTRESDGMSFGKIVRKMVQDIRTDMFKIQEESLGLDFDDPLSHQKEIMKNPYQLIITSPIKSGDKFNTRSFVGGDSPILMAYLAFIIQEPSVKDKLLKKKPYISIIKNRIGMGNKNVSLDEILLPLERESKLNKVLN